MNIIEMRNKFQKNVYKGKDTSIIMYYYTNPTKDSVLKNKGTEIPHSYTPVNPRIRKVKKDYPFRNSEGDRSAGKYELILSNEEDQQYCELTTEVHYGNEILYVIAREKKAFDGIVHKWILTLDIRRNG